VVRTRDVELGLHRLAAGHPSSIHHPLAWADALALRPPYVPERPI
jgi:hypothetical protein